MKKLLGLVAAAGVGYVAGLLFAPKSGKETRSDIKSKLDNLKETTSEKVDNWRGDDYYSSRSANFCRSHW